MDRLPAEILHAIFQQIEPSESRNFALVCKAWKDPALEIFYSNVRFISTSQMKKFLDTIKHKPQLANLVKTLQTSYVGWRNPIEDFMICVSLLYTSLPNLEAITVEGIYTYELMINALKESKLTRLKRVPEPGGGKEVTKYVDCALLLTDRLENIYIGESKDQQVNSDFQRLYNNLDQFNKLTHVKIMKLTNNEIPLLEHVSDNCKSLKDITLNTTSSRNWSDLPQRQNNVTNDAISKYIPNTITKKLNASFNSYHGYEVLPYTIHKFPQLDELKLSFGGEYGPAKYDINMANRLMNYLSRIKKFHIYSLKLNQVDITEAIGNLWDTTSKPGQQRLEIGYSDEMDNDKKAVLDISSYNSFLKSPYTKLIYNGRDFNWDVYKKFIEKNGKYIGDMQFDVTIEWDDYASPCLLPEDFLAHLFTHCRNLRKLKLETCNFNRIVWMGFDESEKISIDTLNLQGCNASSVYEQLSERFSDIKLLNLGFVGYSPSEGKRSVPDVNMPYTKINTMSVFYGSDHDVLYVKVLATSDKSIHYYRYTYRHLEESNEQEYEVVNRDTHIYICCQNKPKIQLYMAP